VFDAGSGIISLGHKLMQQKSDLLNIALFLTHAHGDHLIGFPFFTPLFSPKTNLHLFGPLLAGKSVEQIVTPFMSAPYFPVDVRHLPSHRTFHTIVNGQCIIWSHGQSEPIVRDSQLGFQEKADPTQVRVIAMFIRSHPLNGTVIYRIEYAGRRVIYATDVEWHNGYDSSFLAFVEGADLLIHDAQYTTDDYQQNKHGYGHSTVEMAVEVAHAAHVRELILFHHEPTYDDDQLDHMEAQAQARFACTRSACEGMEINLLA